MGVRLLLGHVASCSLPFFFNSAWHMLNYTYRPVSMAWNAGVADQARHTPPFEYLSGALVFLYLVDWLSHDMHPDVYFPFWKV